MSHICYSDTDWYVGKIQHTVVSYWTGACPGSKTMASLYQTYEDAYNVICNVKEFYLYLYQIENTVQEFSTQIII